MPDDQSEAPPSPSGGGGVARRDDPALIMLAMRIEDLSEGMVRLTTAVRELIRQVELLSARVAAVERAIPLRRPNALPPKQPPRSSPPKRG